VEFRRRPAAWGLGDDAPGDDDVGVVGVDDRPMVAPGGQRQHHVVAGERTEVGHQGGQVVAGLEQDELAARAQLGGASGDPSREVGVGDGHLGGDHRDVVAVAGEVVDEPFEHHGAVIVRRVGGHRTRRRRR
jgi:hypothetical protein